jgi:hypothetical protein
VARLNAISNYLRGKLKGNPANWRVATLFTSKWAIPYHRFHKGTAPARVATLLKAARKGDITKEPEIVKVLPFCPE